MYPGFAICKPFFEFGPKVYLYGDKILELALHADELCQKYDVDVIFSAQYTDIERIAKRVRRLKVFAQHMDPHPMGRGIGAVLAESLKDAGAQGVLLNHAERPMNLADLNAAIQRADTVGLATLVCAGTVAESAAVACLRPNLVLAESPALIGAGKRSEKDRQEIERINQAVRAINPGQLVLHAAGIHDDEDVYQVILAGADGTGSTSGIIKAPDQKEMFAKMIRAVRQAYDKRTMQNEGGRNSGGIP